MKKTIATLLALLVVVGGIYAQQLGTPTPVQQRINALQAVPIPLVGKSFKFDFGGDIWNSKISGANFLAGDCTFVENGSEYEIVMNITHVWSGAIEEVIDFLKLTGVPLGPAESPLRMAAKVTAAVAKWIPLKGSILTLRYNESSPVRLAFVSMKKQEKDAKEAKVKEPKAPKEPKAKKGKAAPTEEQTDPAI